MSKIPLGRFSWYELMTTDPDAARDFYRRVTGWTTCQWEEGEGPYEMWMNGETPIGGLIQLPAPDVPPCWMVYLSTPDLTGTLDRVKGLGGSVLMEIGVPLVGRFAVIADPQGAVIAVIEPEGEAGGHDGPAAVGEFSWCDLATSDLDAAWSFYTQVFDWREAGRMDMGPRGSYQMFNRGAHTLGGMLNAPEGTPVGWYYYVRVPDAHVAAETVKQLGGRVTAGPMQVPGGDFMAHCMDPQGVPFAVHSKVQAPG
jgi:predicted enzyme related to lactoylglutathione lyase